THLLTSNPFNYRIYWNRNSTFLEIALHGASSAEGWFGLGISPITSSMKDADIFMGYFSETQAFLNDYYGTGLEKPLKDPDQKGLRLTSSRRDSVGTVFEFERDFNTGDLLDVIINPDDTLPILWSIGNSQPESPTDFTQHFV